MNIKKSIELSTMEQLTINNSTNATLEFIKKIKTYISNITALEEIEDLYIDLISIDVDGEERILKDKFIDEISGKDILVDYFKEVLEKLEKANVINLFTSYACAYDANVKYGYAYMTDFLTEDLKENISYRCLESSEAAGEVRLYRFGDFQGFLVDENLSCNNDFKVVDDIETWYSNDFNYHIKVSNKSEECLLSDLTGYIEKIEELCEDYDGETVTKVKKDDSFYYIGVQSPIECSSETLKIITAYVIEINTLTTKLDGTFKLSGRFIPDNSHVFATAGIVLDDNEYALKATRI